MGEHVTLSTAYTIFTSLLQRNCYQLFPKKKYQANGNVIGKPLSERRIQPLSMPTYQPLPKGLSPVLLLRYIENFMKKSRLSQKLSLVQKARKCFICQQLCYLCFNLSIKFNRTRKKNSCLTLVFLL